jgi:outer membrane protein assembly factor BamE (lipoprotein component of BamABCDE complex)
MSVGGFIIGRRQAKAKLCRSQAVSVLLAAGLLLPAMIGCTPTIQTHGHSLEEEQVAKVKPGETSRQEVLQLLGSPSALSTFDDDAWYYVSQRTEKTSFYQEGVVSQDVLTIAFDDQGRVISVDRHGLEQVASIDPVDRVTPTAGSSPSILQQLIGNIGRFSSAPGADSP